MGPQADGSSERRAFASSQRKSNQILRRTSEDVPGEDEITNDFVKGAFAFLLYSCFDIVLGTYPVLCRIGRFPFLLCRFKCTRLVPPLKLTLHCLFSTAEHLKCRSAHESFADHLVAQQSSIFLMMHQIGEGCENT